MASDAAFSRAVSTVGFIFGACQARALPGPILVELLGEVGMSGSAARQLLKRMTGVGALNTERHGRVTVYKMAGDMLLRFNTIRLGRTAPPWRGSFEVVVYDLGERERIWRDRLRATATSAGFAALRPGVLIGFESPDPWLRHFSRLRDQLGLLEVGAWDVDLGTAQRVAARAWEIDTHRDAILAGIRHIEAIGDAEPTDGWGALRQLQLTVSTAASLWLSVPRLPTELTPADWPMRPLARAVDAVSARTDALVGVTLRSYLQEHRYAELVGYYTAHPWSVPEQ